LGAFVLMLAVNLELALITAAIVPAIAWVTSRYGAQMTHNFRTLYGRVAAFNVRIEENVGGMRVVQAFANEDHERALFASDNANYRRTKLDAYRVMAANSSLSYFGTRLIQMLVMVAGTWFVLHGGLSAGGFVGFLLLVSVFLRPIDKITNVLESYPKGIAGFRRYTELIDTAPDIADAPGAIDVATLRGDIRFESVRFGYAPGKFVLDNVDLSISAGETIAFVGPSGAGKTTLCSLLPRFFDGMDIQGMTLQSLRRQIGIVQQDVFLFGGTMRENIAYGRLDASEADILEAARRARLDAVIDEMPDGLDTLIGERGVKLSGGQKQRLAIARMFLKNPPILILDEATSALDTETERAIQRSLADLSKGRTTLVIAHRLATIRNADRIVVVDGAGIAEEGIHRDLLAMGGLYQRLHNAQFSEAAE
jgi:ATP-binding cassette, subfamily B, bacterial